MDMDENKMEGIGSVEKNDDSQEEKKIMKFLNTKLIALFVLGVLIGLTVKTQASKTITMGFDDYKIKNPEKQELRSSDLKKEEQQEAEESVIIEEESQEAEAQVEGLESNEEQQEVE